MAIYEDDQSKLGTVVTQSGVHASVNATQLKASSPAGTVYTFTATWSHTYKGQHLSYRKNMSYSLDATLKAALLAAAAPMVAA